ncbi:hypothetical protein DEO72_LG2g3488 [Vigna unguiculata]|uniref:Secreted protein n=1 Tax=Vigna unguiculata TaxID=3917 RepID=A0A4D6L3V3_VIGUN|nr:hypothetical protein DEO72_LG2g3488 [Vigna unguiculata]
MSQPPHLMSTVTAPLSICLLHAIHHLLARHIRHQCCRKSAIVAPLAELAAATQHRCNTPCSIAPLCSSFAAPQNSPPWLPLHATVSFKSSRCQKTTMVAPPELAGTDCACTHPQQSPHRTQPCSMPKTNARCQTSMLVALTPKSASSRNSRRPRPSGVSVATASTTVTFA